MKLLDVLFVLSSVALLKCNGQVLQSVSMISNQIFISFLNYENTTKITFTTINDNSVQPTNGIWIAIGFNDQP